MSLHNKILLIYLLSSKICCIGLSWFTTQSPTETGPPSLDTKSERRFPGRNRGRMGKSKASGSILKSGRGTRGKKICLHSSQAHELLHWMNRATFFFKYFPAGMCTNVLMNTGSPQPKIELYDLRNAVH